MLAFSTSHVVATSILFNRRVTSRAFLRIGRDPIRSLRIIGTLLQPFLDQRARGRLMVCQNTAKAPSFSANASHSRDDIVQILLLDRAFYGVNTIWRRTPFEKFLVFYVSSSKKFMIPVVPRFGSSRRIKPSDSGSRGQKLG